MQVGSGSKCAGGLLLCHCVADACLQRGSSYSRCGTPAAPWERILFCPCAHSTANVARRRRVQPHSPESALTLARPVAIPSNVRIHRCALARSQVGCSVVRRPSRARASFASSPRAPQSPSSFGPIEGHRAAHRAERRVGDIGAALNLPAAQSRHELANLATILGARRPPSSALPTRGRSE